VELRNCRFSNNQLHDIAAFGARSYPASVGMPGTNNRVKIRLIGTLVPVFETADSIPDNPALMNSVTVIRSPITSSFDYDGDGRADLSVFRPSDRTWYLNRNQGGFDAVQFGLATDKIVPADYDGDGKTDIAVYRAGIWYLRRSQLGLLTIPFGDANDIPQPADFDGDGKAEITVWRPSNGVWYVYNLATSQFSYFQLGASTDKPVIGDYDGDGKADVAVFRPSNGTWYIQRSRDGLTQMQLGEAQDKPVPADYDGDGKTDIAVFRPSEGNWYIRRSASNTLQVVNWGLGTDALVPADYDGDGKTDIAVYRGGIWYIRQTSSGINYTSFGLSSDLPTNQAR
ncbi:MAG: VCBS repeat-containing protein, partial [Acidobacteria bacterium]|nr:VCBS repeat-containing protein [Acidobacteriota bacterium]